MTILFRLSTRRVRAIANTHVVLTLLTAFLIAGCKKVDQPKPDESATDSAVSDSANQPVRSDDQQEATPVAKKPSPVQPPPMPLPAPGLDEFPEAVQRQINDARAKATAQPDDAEAVGRVAMLYQAYELLDAAEMWYRQAIQLEPTRFRWNYLLAHVYSHKGDAEKAVEAFVRAILLQPEYVPAKITLANLLLNSGSFDQALRLVDDARRYDNESPIVGYTAGMIHLAREHFAESANEFERVLETHPQFGNVRGVLADTYRQLSRSDDADQLLADRIPNNDAPRLSDPERAAAYRLATGYDAELLKGVAYMQRNNPAVALEHFEKAMEFEPADPTAQLKKSEALVSLRRFAEAEKLLIQLVDQDKQNTEAQLRLGDVLLMQNKPEEVFAIIKKLERRDPDNLTLVGLKARYAMATKDYKKAIIAYEHLARANPENVHVLLELANARLLNGEHDNAKRAYLRVLELRPQDPYVMNRLAMAYVRDGDFKVASSWFKRSIESEYAAPAFFLDYAAAAATEKDFELSAQILRNGRDRFPKSGDLAFKQARLLAMCPDEKLRDGEKALELARQLNQQFADSNPEVVDVLAVALAATGDADGGIEKLEGVLSNADNLTESTANRLREHLKIIKSGGIPSEAP